MKELEIERELKDLERLDRYKALKKENENKAYQLKKKNKIIVEREEEISRLKAELFELTQKNEALKDEVKTAFWESGVVEGQIKSAISIIKKYK